MPTLKVVFGGLLGYAEKGTSMRVLLMRVGRARASVNPDELHTIHLPHLALLRVNAKYIANFPDSTRQPDRIVKGDDPSSPDCLFVLKWEELTFNGITTGPLTQKEVAGVDPEVPPFRPSTVDQATFDEEKVDARWLMPMEIGFPGCGKIDPDCIGSNHKELINARFTLDGGELSSRRLGGEGVDDMGQPIVSVYTFIKGLGAPEKAQAMAEETLWEVECGAQLLLDSSPIKVREEKKDTLTMQAVDGVIEVTVRNAEAEELISKDPNVGNRDPEDFELLYELCDKRPPFRGRRVPSGDGGGGDRICPGAKFTS